jgi:hypothetical protein
MVTRPTVIQPRAFDPTFGCRTSSHSSQRPSPTGMMRVVTIALSDQWWEPPKSDEMILFVEKIGESYVAQLPSNAPEIMDEQTKKNWHKSWEEAKTIGYLAHARIKKTDDGLEFAFLDPKFIEKQIAEKKLPGTVEEKTAPVTVLGHTTNVDSKKIMVSASTEELCKFFTQHIDAKLFGEKTVKWTRVK